MAGFTPGPWRAGVEADEWTVDNGWDNEGLAYKHVGIANDDPIAIVVVPASFGMDEELDANARLIAAAPDLLSALRALMESMEARLDGEGGTPTEYREVEAARAAIAKVEDAS